MVNERNVQEILDEMRRSGKRLEDNSVPGFITGSYLGPVVETYHPEEIAEASRRYRKETDSSAIGYDK